MKKVCVLGAGISGLSFAKMASAKFDVEVLEKNEVWGGIARTKKINGVTYHPVGGHCFNSKFPEVMDFVFNHVLSKDNWHLINRNAVIKMQGEEINYPIEYSIKEINSFNPDLALKITKDFLSSTDDNQYDNLEQWFRKKFGDTLAELYFIPYNKKIWNNDPSLMSHDWVEGKLPIPNKESFFQSLIGNATDKMPHATFYYPKSNDQNTFIDALAKDLVIKCDYEVKEIEFNSDKKKWVINGDREYDLIVSTLPLNLVCKLIVGTPRFILEQSKKLKYNSVTTMFWETEPTERTWTYVPEGENIFHRYIHVGNFFNPKQNYSITEVVGKKTYEEMVKNGEKDSFLKKPVGFNVSEHAYVVFDQNYSSAVKSIKSHLNEMGIETLGRFGEWEYYNMDVCIKSSMNLFEKMQRQN